jgi:hypothetical protein
MRVPLPAARIIALFIFGIASTSIIIHERPIHNARIWRIPPFRAVFAPGSAADPENRRSQGLVVPCFMTKTEFWFILELSSTKPFVQSTDFAKGEFHELAACLD